MSSERVTPQRLDTRTAKAVAMLGTGTMVWLVNMVTQFALTPLYLRYVSSEGYGLWLFLLATLCLFGLSDLGVVAATRPLAIQRLAVGDFCGLQSLYSAAFWTRLAIGGGILIVGWFCWPLVLAAAKAAPAESGDLRLAYVLVLLALLLEWMSSVFGGFISARQLEYRLVWANLARALAGPAISLGLLLLHGRVSMLAVGMLGGSAVSLFLSARTFCQAYPELRFLPARPTCFEMRCLLSLSVYFFIDGASAFLVDGISRIAVQNKLGASELSAFALTGFFYQIINQAVGRVLGVVAPGIGDLLARQLKVEAGRVLMLVYVLTVTLTFGVFPLVWGGNAFVVSHWTSQAVYSGASTDLLLVLRTMLMVGVTPGLIVLGATGQMRGKAVFTVVAGAINVALLLVFTERWGLMAVAGSGLVALVSTLSWYIPWRAARICPLGAVDRRILLRFLAGVAVSGVAMGGLLHWLLLPVTPLLQGACILVAGYVVQGAFLLWLIPTSIKDMVERRFPAIRRLISAPIWNIQKT